MPDKRQGRTGQVKINGNNYFLFEEIGRGAASICYRAIRDSKRYVVKEYFPVAIAVRDADGNVIPSDEENAEEIFTKKKSDFISSARFHQNRLHDIQQNDFLSVIEYDEGNGFVVMNDTDGQTLASWAEKQTVNDDYVRKCIQIVKGIIEETEKYHKAGYVHLDLKAENVYKFNIENDQTLTRIFDFDSIQNIDSLYDSIQSKKAHIHTTNECYGREIRDINSQKADYITKEMLVRLDYYAIIKILHFLLYGCYEKTVMDDKTPFEEYYADCTVLNNYLGNMFYGLLKAIDKRDYTVEGMKVYLDKLGFIIDNKKHWMMYSKENLKQNFKSSLMSDMSVDDTLYTMNKGISAVEQVAERYDDHLFLHGHDGGRGKTTAMQWLMFRMMCDLKPIHLYFPLNYLSNEFDIEEQICQRYSLKEIPQNATILFDGYNEIENKEVKDKFDEYIEKDLSERKYRVIVSGRNTEGLFEEFICCTLTGLSETQRKRNSRITELLSNELFSNPMLVSLYSGIDMNNIPSKAKEHMIGVIKGDKIEATTMGEALWNYFYIQIYEKSNGDERAKEEYTRFFFELMPRVAECPASGWTHPNAFGTSPSNVGTTRGEATGGRRPNSAGRLTAPPKFSPDEEKVLVRCNKLFNVCHKSTTEWWRRSDGFHIEPFYAFNHYNYYDFFNAINIVNKIVKLIKDERAVEIFGITDMAFEIMGTQYTEPKVIENSVIVPKGHAASYYGCGKEIIEEKQNVIYAYGKNLALVYLEASRGKFQYSEWIIQEDFIRRLPKKHMNFSRINIGQLFEDDYDINEYYGEEDPYNFADTEDVEVFENTCFDGAFIKLQDNTSEYFKNCSFKRLKKGSSIPYSLYNSSDGNTVKVGECIYSRDKSILVDYVGPDSGKTEVTLFENTEKICDEFKLHCKNPDIRIISHSKSFRMSGNGLYRICNEDGLILEFCRRNAKTLTVAWNTTLIRNYACAHCTSLKELELHDDTIICEKAFYGCNTLGIVTLWFGRDFKNIPSTHKLILYYYTSIDLAEIAKIKDLRDVYIHNCHHENGSISRRGQYLVNPDVEYDTVRIYDVNDSSKKRQCFDLEYMFQSGDRETARNYTPQNLTIHLPFEPDRDEMFGIKLKKYER